MALEIVSHDECGLGIGGRVQKVEPRDAHDLVVEYRDQRDAAHAVDVREALHLIGPEVRMRAEEPQPLSFGRQTFVERDQARIVVGPDGPDVHAGAVAERSVDPSL